MEQVKSLSRKINAIEAPRLLSSSPGCHITCALIWLSFPSPDGKFHMQSCSICQQSRLGLFFVAMAAWPPTVLCPLFVWTNQGSRLMREDMLIIIHLPPQLRPRAAGHQSRILFFSSPPAGLPAGAARLPGREVTTRGRPNVITGPEEAHSAADAFIHSFISTMYYKDQAR